MEASHQAGYPTYAYRDEVDGKILLKIRFLNPNLVLVKDFKNGLDLSYFASVTYNVDGDTAFFETLFGVSTIDFPNDKYWTKVDEESGHNGILIAQP